MKTKIELVREMVGQEVMTTEPGRKLIKSVAPHGPYKLLKITKSGMVLLQKSKGTFVVSPKSIIFMNEITKKWESTGLLDSLPYKSKDRCAKNLEYIYNLFLLNRDSLKDKYIAGFLLPLVVRCEIHGLNFEMDWLFKDFISYSDNGDKTKFGSFYGLDDECKFLDEYVEKLKSI